jgi:hypothetical protein
LLVLLACGGRACGAPGGSNDFAASSGGAEFIAPKDACASMGTPHDYSSADELEPLLTGRWMLCDPMDSGFCWGEGVDLLADGSCYILVRSGGHVYRSGYGADAHSYSVTVAPPADPRFDLEFTTGGVPPIAPRDHRFKAMLYDHPRKLVLTDDQYQYVFAPAQ